MFRYRNAETGRILERPVRDEWLEASSGWTREEEPKAKAKDNEEKEND